MLPRYVVLRVSGFFLALVVCGPGALAEIAANEALTPLSPQGAAVEASA